ncbi:MAG: PLDc N-terminal domain-containing protein [Deltaproteobacteria bacterium]|nr:PLDc N-terminal domain-containing protein [Deltaproteobacteria bacterium]
MLDWLQSYGPYLGGALVLTTALSAAIHAILHKRDSRAATGWVAVILALPLLGAAFYALFGINRIQRRALALRGDQSRVEFLPKVEPVHSDALHEAFGPPAAERGRLVRKVTQRPLLPGNKIEPLAEGDTAFPAMLDAIEGAQRSITLTTYIFDNDPVGHRFVEALVRAVERRIHVRVLIDAAGVRYSRPPIHRELKRRGVPTALFMPIVFARLFHLNLRTHRKILVVDGELGFTGGINLRQGHELRAKPRRPVRDLHFCLEGPVVSQLQEVFSEDWEFSTGESLRGPPFFANHEVGGESLARAISDGPDDDLDRLHWTLLGAIASAQRSIKVLTPYFLPELPLITALNVAALRGIRVDIVLPEKVNIRPVGWAMSAQIWRVLQHGCRVWLTPPPFDHAKLMIVDDHWVLFGSSNWDPRSLRLNFELNVEVYDRNLARELTGMLDERIISARRLEIAELEARSVWVRLRDGVARLAAPYL